MLNGVRIKVEVVGRGEGIARGFVSFKDCSFCILVHLKGNAEHEGPVTLRVSVSRVSARVRVRVFNEQG